MVVRPRVDCLAFDQLASRCSYVATEIEVPLNGQWSESRDIVVSFSWTQDANRPIDAERFLVGFSLFDYKAKGASFERPPERTESFNYSSGYGYAPELRCDRKVAQINTDGCVFTQAAPVYVLSKAAGLDVQEAAQHIFEAQNNADPARRSPGKWLLKAGTRAVADDSVLANNALQRAKSLTVQTTNRKASCANDNPNSLIKIRVPINQSASCVAGTQTCSCDEYPFASTWSGGNFDPGRTSVKIVNDKHNIKAGSGKLTTFFNQQRVLDFTVYPEQVQPYDPNAVSNRGGDDFWVHVK